MPRLTQGLISANAIAFLLEQRFGSSLIGAFALWPPAGGLFMRWQVLSYAFLHANVTHLAFTMFGLWTVRRPARDSLLTQPTAILIEAATAMTVSDRTRLLD